MVVTIESNHHKVYKRYSNPYTMVAKDKTSISLSKETFDKIKEIIKRNPKESVSSLLEYSFNLAGESLELFIKYKSDKDNKLFENFNMKHRIEDQKKMGEVSDDGITEEEFFNHKKEEGNLKTRKAS